jgi:hypothetical protein
MDDIRGRRGKGHRWSLGRDPTHSTHRKRPPYQLAIHELVRDKPRQVWRGRNKSQPQYPHEQRRISIHPSQPQSQSQSQSQATLNLAQRPGHVDIWLPRLTVRPIRTNPNQEAPTPSRRSLRGRSPATPSVSNHERAGRATGSTAHVVEGG